MQHIRGRRARHLACPLSLVTSLSLTVLAAVPAAGQVFAPPSPLNSNAASDTGSDRHPRLVSDGAGTWIAVWYSNEPLPGTGTDTDILFARSTDDGATWSAPAALNASAFGDTRGDANPDVATDGTGTWVAVWDSNGSLGDTIGSDDDILFARSTDDGLTWSAVGTVNHAITDSGADVEPRIATDGAGKWVVVWETTDGLGASTGNDRDIASATSSDGGLTWSAPTSVNTSATTDSKGDFGPHVATDGSKWIAVWRTQDTLGGQLGGDDDVLLARSNDGLVWSPPQLLNTNAKTDSGGDFEPFIASDGPNHWLAAWRSQEAVASSGTDDDILLTRSSDGGTTWSAPAILNANATFDVRGDYEPVLGGRGDGEWLAAWRSRDTLAGTGGPTKGTDDDIVFARSLDDGLTWTMPVPVAAYALSDDSDDLAPYLVADASGLLVVAWESRHSLGGTIGTDADILIARGSICGDGAVGPGEQCDDGNQNDGDCCTNTCTLDGGSICDDGNPCTTGDGCFGGECAGLPVECGMCETCVIEAGGCTSAPRTDCVTSSDPSRGQLQFKNKASDAGDRVLFKFFRGGAVSEAGLGDPTSTSDHALCLWDESDQTPSLVFRATAPAGGTCNGADCWQHAGPVSLYKDTERTPDGIKGIVVRAGDAGRSQVSLKGKGEPLGARPLGTPILPLELPALAQFQIRGGACWQARYTEAGVKRNDDGKFKAVGSE